MRKAPNLKVVAADGEAISEPDGRRRRSHDSRARIVAAMLELIRAGEVSPGAEQVAARAQVGLRTVFRHFDDMDSLYNEMSSVIEAELAAIASQPFKGDSWRARILELIERRAYAFERIAPFKRAADFHRHESPFLADHQARLASALRAILRRAVTAEVAADATTFEALDLLLSYEVWSRLRTEQGLTPKRARSVLETAVRRIVEENPPPAKRG